MKTVSDSDTTLKLARTHRRRVRRYLPPRSANNCRKLAVGICGPAAVTGSRMVTNDELLHGHPERTADDILQRTGIATRPWVTGGEDPLDLAVRASRKLLNREGLTASDVDGVICTTSTPTSVTPSLACRVLFELSDGEEPAGGMAFDINAACSGFLYALRNAFDMLQGNPDGRLLIVTSEVLSPLLDPEDFGTRCLFGDAASATIVSGAAHLDTAWARLHQPVLSSKPEDGSLLSVPLPGQGYIRMQGRRVFEKAVRSMFETLQAGCQASRRKLEELDLVVPHQANQRILDSVGRNCPIPIFSNILNLGNTASTSIPLALRDICQTGRRGQKLGLCTFGGGFTCGAVLLDLA